MSLDMVSSITSQERIVRAVVAAETGETEYPADMLEVMQDLYSVRWPLANEIGSEAPGVREEDSR
jgi:hypothetical protein